MKRSDLILALREEIKLINYHIEKNWHFFGEYAKELWTFHRKSKELQLYGLEFSKDKNNEKK